MQPLRRQYTYDDARLLFETRHYADKFSECIDDIVSHKQDFVDKEIFTKWYYNNYDVNKIAGVNLNLIIEDMTDNKGYIIREKNDEYITIYINKLFYNDDNILKSLIQHELIHIVKMYSDEKNGLFFTKETVRDEIDDILNEFDLSFLTSVKREEFIDDLDTILYILTPNEQLASINATCKYVSGLTYDNVRKINDIMFGYCSSDLRINFKVGLNNFTTKQSQVINIVVFLSEALSTNFNTQYETVLSEWKDYTNQFKCILCYYLDKHNHIKAPYIRKNIQTILNNEIFTNNDVTEDIATCNEYITYVYEKYRKDVLDAVYDIIYKKNLFLTNADIKWFKSRCMFEHAYGKFI